jgi:3-methyladenine DNA glycosylase AlkD
MTLEEILAELHSLGNERNREGMARFGINPGRALGVSVNDLRRIGRKVRPRDHTLAAQLWDTGIQEARILASIVDDPKAVTEAQMESWVAAFDSWDLCDQCCSNLFARTPYAWARVVEWSERAREFEKRAAFATVAYLTHDKRALDEPFLAFLPIIRREAGDPRNYVKKAVNWALREIGKRNLALNAAAIDTARHILADAAEQGKRGGGRRTEGRRTEGRWVASDALRELASEKTQARLRK